jgi:hypothetical protein|tara:strand:- start:2523 stop:2912 length:390 start_codon:yes stop_codon:yes gene_type:complete
MIEFLVLSIAIILLYLFLPVVVGFYIIKYLLTGNRRELKVWFFRSAREIDVFANVVGSDLFNAIFIVDGGYKFGNPKETISSVLGKNQRDKTLSLAGNLLRWILDLIDDNHCIKSINDEVTNTKKDISK